MQTNFFERYRASSQSEKWGLLPTIGLPSRCVVFLLKVNKWHVSSFLMMYEYWITSLTKISIVWCVTDCYWVLFGWYDYFSCYWYLYFYFSNAFIIFSYLRFLILSPYFHWVSPHHSLSPHLVFIASYIIHTCIHIHTCVGTFYYIHIILAYILSCFRWLYCILITFDASKCCILPLFKLSNNTMYTFILIN